MCLDSAYDLLYLTSDTNLGTEQLFRLRHCLAGNDFAYLELKLSKIIIGNLRLCLNINNLRCARFFTGTFLCCSGSRSSLHGFYFLHYLFHVHTGKKDLRLIRHMVSGWVKPKLIHLLQTALLCVKLLQNLCGSIRHEGFQQGSANGNRFCQVIEHGLQPALFRLVLCQNPWRRLINIFIASSEYVENLGNGIGHAKLLHLLTGLFHFVQYDCLQIVVHLFRVSRIGNHPAKILVGHGNRTVYQISKDVGQVRVHTLHH